MIKFLPIIALGVFYGLYLGNHTGFVVALVTGVLMQLYVYIIERENKPKTCLSCHGTGYAHYGLTTEQLCLTCSGTGKR